MIAKVLHKTRLIIAVEINGKAANMLVDTGASLSVIDIALLKEYGFRKRTKLQGTITGVGGAQKNVWHTGDLSVNIQGIPLYQFVATDISDVCESIRKATGIAIHGIIGLPQIKAAEMKIDAENGVIKIGY